MRISKSLRRLALVAATASVLAGMPATAAHAVDEPITGVSPTGALNNSTEKTVTFNVTPTYMAVPKPTVTFTRHDDSTDTFNVDPTKVTVSGTTFTVMFTINRRNPGPWDIKVTGGFVQDGADTTEVISSCSSCFSVLSSPPTVVKAVTPVHVNATPVVLTLTGTNFTDDVYCVSGDCSGEPTVTVSGTGVTLANATSGTPPAAVKATPTTISLRATAATSAASGFRDITITNTDGKAAVCDDCLLVSPNVTSVTYPEASSPTTPYGQGATSRTLRINGNGFQPGATVAFSNPTGVTINSTEFVSTSVLELDVTLAEFGSANAPTLTSNNRAARVTNPDGGKSLDSAFFNIAIGPKITTVAPVEGGRTETIDFTLTGVNFALPTAGGVTVLIDDVTVNSYKATNTAEKVEFNATIGSGLNIAGVRDVTIVNNNNKGQYVCHDCFTVENLQVNSITPSDVLNDSAQQFTISGSGFALDAIPTLVKKGTGAGTVADITGTSTTVNGTGTSLTTTFPIEGAAPGEWYVRITNPTTNPGTGSCACLNIVAATPDITTVSPSSRGAGAQDQTIEINGSGFAPGAAVTFTNAGVTLVGPPVVTPNKITVIVDIAPGSQDLPANPPPGPQVRVTNTDGQFDAATFTVNEGPSVASVDKPSRALGTNTTVTVSGQGFVSGATYTISGNGLTIGAMTFTAGPTPADADKLAASVTVAEDADLTQRDITVKNPDGGQATCTCKFTVTAQPNITTVVPNKIAKGATTSVTINGDGFSNAATVVLSPATDVTPTVTNRTAQAITVSFNVAAGAALGDRNVVVDNGDGGTATKVNGIEVITVPGAPTGATATRGNASATVSWTAPTSDGGEPITSYTVTSNPGGVTKTTSDGQTTTAVVTGLTNGTSYTFTVFATNDAGNSAASTASNAVTPATVPDPPTAVSATAGAGQATVNWSAPASNGGSPLTGYTVTSSPGNHTASVNGTTTQAVVPGLTNGTAYKFTVKATNAIGDSLSSAESNEVTPLTVPDAPTSVTATALDQSAQVSWNAPASNGGSAITGYTVTSNPGGFIAQTNGNTLTATVNGLTNGTSYTFTVTATNAKGTSAASAPSNAVTPAAVPSAPTAVTATGGNGQAHVTWTAPASTNGSAITGYTVTSSPGGITKSVNGSTLAADVTGLTNGTSYTFTVTATNGAGTSAASAPSNAVTPMGPPLAPPSATATAGHGAAGVSWTPANGNGASVTSYTVTASPGGATKVVSGLSTTFTGLTNGTSYTFTVKATNAVGTGPGRTTNAVVPTWVTSLSESATKAMTAGGTATVTGKLTRSDGAGLSGRPIKIYRRVAPATTYTYVRTVMTGTGGVWKTTFTLSKNTYFQARYLGATGYDPATSAVRLTKVAYKVNASYSLSGRTVTVSGAIWPNAAGRTAYLRLRRSDGSVVNLKTATVAANGTYRMSRALSPGTYTLYVYIAGSTTNTAGRSPYRSTRIT